MIRIYLPWDGVGWQAMALAGLYAHPFVIQASVLQEISCLACREVWGMSHNCVEIEVQWCDQSLCITT